MQTLSFTKSVRSHLYGISLFVLENELWCASGEHLRIFDSMSGKINKMIDSKTNKNIKCLLLVSFAVGSQMIHQVWCGSDDKRIYIFDATKYEFIKVIFILLN